MNEWEKLNVKKKAKTSKKASTGKSPTLQSIDKGMKQVSHPVAIGKGISVVASTPHLIDL